MTMRRRWQQYLHPLSVTKANSNTNMFIQHLIMNVLESAFNLSPALHFISLWDKIPIRIRFIHLCTLCVRIWTDTIYIYIGEKNGLYHKIRDFIGISKQCSLKPKNHMVFIEFNCQNWERAIEKKQSLNSWSQNWQFHVCHWWMMVWWSISRTNPNECSSPSRSVIERSNGPASSFSAQNFQYATNQLMTKKKATTTQEKHQTFISCTTNFMPY